MANTFVVASSALFFVPAFLAFFRQSIIVFITFFSAALFSTLYHLSSETDYSELDVIWASFTLLVSLLMLAVLAMEYAPWNWRVLLPLVLGLTGLIIYFAGGQSAEPTQVIETANYDLYHSLWHLFMALAGILLVWTPVDLSKIVNVSYAQLYVKIINNYCDTEFNKKSVFMEKKKTRY